MSTNRRPAAIANGSYESKFTNSAYEITTMPLTLRPYGGIEMCVFIVIIIMALFSWL